MNTSKAPAALGSHSSLRSSLTLFAAVLTSLGFAERGCPFESHPGQHRPAPHSPAPHTSPTSRFALFERSPRPSHRRFAALRAAHRGAPPHTIYK